MPLQVMADYGHGDNAPMLFVELRLSLSPFVPHSYVRVKKGQGCWRPAPQTQLRASANRLETFHAWELSE
jgi:hypothetical protein